MPVTPVSISKKEKQPRAPRGSKKQTSIVNTNTLDTVLNPTMSETVPIEDVFNHPQQNNTPSVMEGFSLANAVPITSVKRGRKPNGGKLINKTLPPASGGMSQFTHTNIVLHLKCSMKYLQNYNTNLIQPASETTQMSDFSSPYNLVQSTPSNISPPTTTLTTALTTALTTSPTKTDTCKQCTLNKNINSKLTQLATQLHLNHLPSTTSDCFWCSLPFTTEATYIPTKCANNIIYCYGCFCHPSCGVAYLFNEHIDTSVKFDRLQLINYLYGNIYGEKNISPALSPYYTLNKYYGTLTPDEYKALNHSNIAYTMANKPLTQIMPELNHMCN